MKDIHDVIKHAKFGDDRLRGSAVVSGQISAFPIDFAGRPYNTLTLPCERVMRVNDQQKNQQRGHTLFDSRSFSVVEHALSSTWDVACHQRSYKINFLRSLLS